MKSALQVIGAMVLLLMSSLVEARASTPVDTLIIRFANNTRLVIYAPDKASIQALSNYDLNKIVREMSMKLDSVPGGQTAISQDGGRFLKDTVLVITRSKDERTIVISDKSDTTKTERKEDTDKNYRDEKRKRRNDWNVDYGVSFGLNSLIQQSAVPAYPADSYELRPTGSRYFALSVGAMPTLIRGKYASLKLYYGLEVAWNNFMFQGNTIIDKTATGVSFTNAGRDLQKSKLTVCTLGIPFVPRVTFYDGDGKKVCHIGLGGYVNYRLDSYRKIKEADGSKDRRHSDYDLNNIRYGLMAHIGIRGLAFFAKYDLSPLFVDGKGPDVRTLAFGLGF